MKLVISICIRQSKLELFQKDLVKKHIHKLERLYKLSFLASGYGQEAFGLSKVLNIHIAEAKKILSEIRAAILFIINGLMPGKIRLSLPKEQEPNTGGKYISHQMK
jgi:hypothetical protein